MYPPDYYETLNKRQIEYEKYNQSFFLVKSSIGGYHIIFRIIPKYVSDLSCRRKLRGEEKEVCAGVQEGGVFFLNYNSHWAAIESYLSDGKLLFQCHVNKAFVTGDERFSHCMKIKDLAIPEKNFRASIV